MSAVIHPSHYNKHPSGVECWEIAMHTSFCMGNAIKYLWRMGSKGNPREDVEKAINYICKEIVRIDSNSNAFFEFCAREEGIPNDLKEQISRNRKVLNRVLIACGPNDPLGILLRCMVDDDWYDHNLVRAELALKGFYERTYGEPYKEK